MNLKTPYLAVDIIIEFQGGIVLIERKNEPFGWALPGGFVDYGETVEAAAVREAKEETSLDIFDIKLLGVYSDPKRDPRLHSVSIAYIAKAKGTPCAQDDAKNIKIFSKNKLPKLCFDHPKILEDYFKAN